MLLSTSGSFRRGKHLCSRKYTHARIGTRQEEGQQTKTAVPHTFPAQANTHNLTKAVCVHIGGDSIAFLPPMIWYSVEMFKSCWVQLFFYFSKCQPWQQAPQYSLLLLLPWSFDPSTQQCVCQCSVNSFQNEHPEKIRKPSATALNVLH